jgi:diguanylate cyclase (GGDEF)-like protein
MPILSKFSGLRILIVAAAAFVAAGVLAVTATVWKLRADAIDDAYQATGNLATVLSEQTSEAVRAIDVILFDIQRELTTQGIITPTDLNEFARSASGHAILKRRLENHPRADVATIVGGDGRLLVSSRMWPVTNHDLSDRDYFNHFIARTDNSTFISVPVINRTTGKPMVFFARRLMGESNAFLGVLTVGIQIEAFKAIYEGIGLLGNQSFLFLRDDGVVLVRYPDDIGRAGEKMPVGSPWYSLVAEKGGHYRSPGFFDDQARLVSVRLVPGYPLVVNVAVAESAALSVWRHRAGMIGAGTLLAVICAGVLLLAVTKQFNQLKLSRAKLARRSYELKIAHNHLDAAVNNLAQGISMFDGEQKLVVCNKPYLDIYGLSPALVRPGITFKKILAQRKQSGGYAAAPEEFVSDMAMQVQQNVKFTHLATTADDRTIRVTAHPMHDGGWVALHEDITERHRADQLIAHIAHHDALTGLPNRIEMEQRLTEAFDNLKQHNKPFALLLVDLDRFKAINDTLGHLAGDALLKDTAARLLSCIRAPDMVARLGGDEFTVLLPTLENAETGARMFANRLISAFAHPFEISSHKIQIGVSIGVAIAPGNGSTITDLMKSADIALYRAKADGRNIFRFYESTNHYDGSPPKPVFRIA